MDNTNMNPETIPKLDQDTATELLNNIFAECEVVPNAIPLETLESWGNYRKTDFRLGRIVSYIVLVIMVLLPLLFFKPTITAERTNVDSSDAAIYEIEVHALLPIDAVSATLDGSPVTLEKVDARNYIVSIPDNGELKVTASTFNGQRSEKTYEVEHVDIDKPELLRSYSEDGNLSLVVRDTYSGINYDDTTIVDVDNNEIEPVSIDEAEGIITFKIPEQPVTVSISDSSGNTLELLISPTEQ